MGASSQQPGVSDDIDEFFEPALADALDDELEDAPTRLDSKAHLAELRRRAELRLERKRLQEEIGYYDLDWEG